ncbi:MAG: subfamily B ATP-binding cassette protein MsbA [Cellvibrionaceae bacterium]|jgi:subfamily B ATP-binding cassette protein MsbA
MSTQSSESSFQLYKRLLTYLPPYWFVLSLGIAGYVLFAYSQTALASMMGDLTDAINADDPSIRYLLPLQLIVIFIYRGIGSFIGDYSFARIAFGIVHTLRRQLFDHLMVMPNNYFDQNSSGQMISRITFDVMQVTQAITDALKILIREGVTVLVLLAYLFWMNWKITLIFIAITPLLFYLVFIISKRLRKLSARIQISMGDITQICAESINNIRVVKLFSGEKVEKERFKAASHNNYRQNMKSMVTTALGTPILQLLAAMAVAVIIYLALEFLNADSPGDFIAYLTATMLIPRSLKQLSGVLNKIQKGIAAAESIFSQINKTSESDRGNKVAEKLNGHLTFRNISFSYANSEKKSLKNFSLDIQPGSTIAFVGRSGSGKTTLVSLLPRFYQDYEGEILLDGTSIKEYTLDSLRSQIAFVGQNITLFNDTIANNIAYGSQSSKNEVEIIDAAKKANAWEFIETLPKQLDTLVGENGARLSGGQRQRLAIARALLKDAPILILDEATAALDNESEQKIQQALDKVMKQRTTLVIAHRLSTIENADQIVVMDQGEMLERGTHQALLAKKGYYWQLHSKSFEG